MKKKYMTIIRTKTASKLSRSINAPSNNSAEVCRADPHCPHGTACLRQHPKRDDSKKPKVESESSKKNSEN